MDFDLRLSNPSSIAQQQKLELISTRFDIAGKAPEGVVDRNWIRKNVMGLTNADIENIEKGREEDKLRDLELEATTSEATGGGDDALGGEDAGEEPPADLFASDDRGSSLLTGLKDKESTDDEEEENEVTYSISDEDAPMKAQSQIRNVFNEPIEKKSIRPSICRHA